MNSGVFFNGVPLDQYLRQKDLKKLEDWRSQHAWLDHVACGEMYMRMAEAATRRKFVTYRELAEGIVFSGPGADPHAPDQGRIAFGTRLPYDTRLFLEDFIIYISAATFRDGEVLIGAIVRDDANLGQPAVSLDNWAQLVGRKQRSANPREAKAFWDRQAEKAFDLYGMGLWRQ